ncbi:MAG: response regulator [Desulfobacterales bacterium]|nr:response regulator [Desulfobacterales bacterium]
MFLSFRRKYKKSLSRKMLIRMSISISIAIIAVSLISYLYVISILESQTMEQLRKYIVERGQRETALFSLVEDNMAIFREKYLSRLKLIEKTDPKEWFNQWFKRNNDGTIRMLPEAFSGTDDEGTNISKGITTYIGKNTTVTDELRRRILVAYDMLKDYGPPWRNRFPNLYLGMGENVTVSYWPEVPYGLNARSDLDIGKEEWFIVTDPEHNPDRGMVWSWLWYDSPAKHWMVSGMIPIDFQGKHIGTAGHDILLDKLLDRTINDHLEGAYNIIFRKDGRLIIHPMLMENILKKQGEFNILEANDPHLKNIFQLVKNRDPKKSVIINSRDNEYIAITHIEGPDWYFVTIYPKSLLANLAFGIAVFVMALGIALLVIEVTILFLLLQKEIIRPLNEFVGVTKEISKRHFGIELIQKLPLQREDEIGELAHYYTHMAEQLDKSFIDLESKVEERTVEIKKSNEQLKKEIEERGQAEEKRIKLEAQLQRARKMEAIGTLAGGVAHDLNNVLSGIVSYPELLLMDMPEDSPLRNPILTIQRSGQKAADIVQDMLTLARRGVVATEITNLNQIVNSYLNSPEYENLKEFHPDVKIESNLETYLLNIMGSSVHLSKTVMNLVVNAAEAMPDGGNVLISAENKYIDTPIGGYDDVKEGDYVVLTISDTGVGISSEDIERIFEPFYTKKKMGKSGTGLGMAVVWGTVKDHKGYIDVQSTEGKGTTFTLYFPVTRKEMSEKEKALPMEQYMGNGESILVVDDVEEQREIASRILKKLGYSVTSVSSGEEAVDYMKDNSADLLVLDMIMNPGIDGLETYRQILKIYPEQKAVIASGFSETKRVKEAQRLGAGKYIKKPYTMEKIGIAVKGELGK